MVYQAAPPPEPSLPAEPDPLPESQRNPPNGVPRLQGDAMLEHKALENLPLSPGAGRQKTARC